MKDLQMVGKRFISQELHVHIGIGNPEDAIKVNNALRVYLPLLLSILTSSPFFEGEDTGLHSYRTKLFEALPLAGMPVDSNILNYDLLFFRLLCERCVTFFNQY
jgi:carboxylate-amine ligase